MTEYISEYISTGEYSCRHCKKFPPDFYDNGNILKQLPQVYVDFFDMFRSIRKEWGRAIVWNSGYRCPYWNTKTGGEDLSVHIFGLAADLNCIDNETVGQLAETINHVNPKLRIGVYKIAPHLEQSRIPWVHFDMGYEIIPRATSAWAKGKRWEKIIR